MKVSVAIMKEAVKALMPIVRLSLLVRLTWAKEGLTRWVAGTDPSFGERASRG